jgi:hypothetical protein
MQLKALLTADVTVKAAEGEGDQRTAHVLWRGLQRRHRPAPHAHRHEARRGLRGRPVGMTHGPRSIKANLDHDRKQRVGHVAERQRREADHR